MKATGKKIEVRFYEAAEFELIPRAEVIDCEESEQ
jgi:hypothetical protein